MTDMIENRSHGAWRGGTSGEMRTWLYSPRAPSYLNSGLLGCVTIGYIEPSSHSLGNWSPRVQYCAKSGHSRWRFFPRPYLHAQHESDCNQDDRSGKCRAGLREMSKHVHGKLSTTLHEPEAQEIPAVI